MAKTATKRRLAKEGTIDASPTTERAWSRSPTGRDSVRMRRDALQQPGELPTVAMIRLLQINLHQSLVVQHVMQQTVRTSRSAGKIPGREDKEQSGGFKMQTKHYDDIVKHYLYILAL